MADTEMSKAACWTVAVACGLVNFLTMAPAKLSGLFFVEIIDRYKTTRELAAYPLFLSMLVRSVGGPLIGYFGQRFGTNPVMLTGCVLSAVGFSACFLAENIYTVIVLLGFVYGFGTALSSILIPEILKRYFNKNVTMANAIALSGTSVGSIVFPPVIAWLLEIYGFSGTLLISGAIILNSLLVPLLFKVLTSNRGSRRLGEPLLFQECNSEPSKGQRIAKAHVSFVHEAISNTVRVNVTDEIKKEAMPEDTDCEIQNIYLVSKQYGDQRPSLIADEVEHEDNINLLPVTSTKFHHSPVLSAKEQSTISKTQSSPRTTVTKSKLKQTPITTLHSIGVFFSLTYWTILITQSFYIIIFMTVLTTMIEYSRDKGIARSKELYFLMCFPVAELFGRLGLAWITDKHYLTENTFSIICYVVLCVSCVFITFVSEFWTMMAGLLTFAVGASSMFTVFPGIVFAYIEKEKQIMGLTSRFALCGLMLFACGPFIGYIRNTLGSYNWVYYILAITSLACGILQASTPYCSRQRERRKAKKEQSES